MTISYTSPATAPSFASDLVAGDISLGYALERRASDRQRAAIARSLPRSRTQAPIRDWLGAGLIRLGRAIAGAGSPAPEPATRLGIG